MHQRCWDREKKSSQRSQPTSLVPPPDNTRRQIRHTNTLRKLHSELAHQRGGIGGTSCGHDAAKHDGQALAQHFALAMLGDVREARKHASEL